MIRDLVFRLVGNFAALWVACAIFDDMTYGDSFGVLLLAAVVFTIVNFFIKPILAILSIPFIIITLGIAYFVINMLMLVLTGAVVDEFDVGSFWTVVGATIVIWFVNTVISMLLRDVRVAPQAGSRMY
jgi:putative membrane protein